MKPVYSPDALPEVVAVLERAREGQYRVRIRYGDADTDPERFRQVHKRDPDPGLDWGDVEEGRVSFSGEPILVYNERSRGGQPILDAAIVRIERAAGGAVLYEHPTYHRAEE